jgi:hypothetical protein
LNGGKKHVLLEAFLWSIMKRTIPVLGVRVSINPMGQAFGLVTPIKNYLAINLPSPPPKKKKGKILHA